MQYTLDTVLRHRLSALSVTAVRRRAERNGEADSDVEHLLPDRYELRIDLEHEEIRPGEEVAKLVKRIHYVSFVGMFRSDLFEGLCVGHAPKKCKICGKWFLTTNARHTKYCGGYAPGDKLHRTCRQIGNLKGREQRELADDHPLKQIYEKRLNTINRYVKRGTLDADLAEIMKKLAKDRMLRALSNVAYAKGTYEKEMEQAALKKEALKRI